MVVQGLGFRPSACKSRICHTQQTRDTLGCSSQKGYVNGVSLAKLS